jgi:hypothetical protein
MAASHPIPVTRIEANLRKLKADGHVLKHFTPSVYKVEPTVEELEVIAKKGRVSTDKKPFDKFEKMEKYVTK